MKNGQELTRKEIIMSIPQNHSNEIHLWAAGGGAVAGALPIGADAIALASEEVIMVIRIGSLFGASIEKSTAQGIVASVIATSVGVAAHAAALAGLESANIGYPFTIPVKIGIAVGIIEVVGRAAYCYFQNKN
jgi:uncharacterized protein (DUF697 family)